MPSPLRRRYETGGHGNYSTSDAPCVTTPRSRYATPGQGYCSASDAPCAPLPRRVPEKNGATPLTGKQLADFVKDGFLVLKPMVPGGDTFHNMIWHGAQQLHAWNEVGNNLLSQLPALDAILDSPEIVGALQSILGEDYVLTASRHCHIAQEGSTGQDLHQDDFFGFNGFRHAAPIELMLMYYPQAVSPLMGPTAVIPGSQYSPGVQIEGQWGPSGVQQAEKLLTLDNPGACMLMHWHLWHHGTKQLGGSTVPVRYMFKFQFRRTRPFNPPAPILTSTCASQKNPFLDETYSSLQLPSNRNASSHYRTCAAVWSVICNEPLPAGQILCNDPLAVASGAWPEASAIPVLVSRITTPLPDPGVRALAASRDTNADMRGVKRLRVGYSKSIQVQGPPLDQRWHDNDTQDSKCEAAAALQLCFPPNPTKFDFAGIEIAKVVTSALRPEAAPVHPWHADWRLEAVRALSALLPPQEALPYLVPLINPPQCPRTQFHALISIFNSGVRCGAPESDEWHVVASTTQVEKNLLKSVSYLMKWSELPWFSGQQRRAADDVCARYALAEALRCIFRFCQQSTVKEAMKIIDMSCNEASFDCSNWRERMLRFLERRRRCPYTTSKSPF